MKLKKAYFAGKSYSKLSKRKQKELLNIQRIAKKGIPWITSEGIYQIFMEEEE